MALDRYFALGPVHYMDGTKLPGWTVADHRQKDPRRHGIPGRPIHEGTMDEDDARYLAAALNRGDIEPNSVAAADLP